MFDAAAAVLAERGRRPLAHPPRFTPLQAAPTGPATAIDGSHAVLVDTGAVWVVAWRAVAARWPGPPLAPPQASVAALVADEADEHVAQAYAAAGLPAPRITTAEGAAGALRSLEEARLAHAALDQLPDDGLLLLDGALDGLPSHAAALWEPLAADSRVAAVAKRSGISDGAPLVPRLLAAGKAALPGRPWATPLPGLRSHACLLHPRAPHAFRVDAAPAVLPRLLPLCQDAVYLGYPYPLVVAHNAVAFTADARRELTARLEAAARRHGAAPLLADPHAMLDRNV